MIFTLPLAVIGTTAAVIGSAVVGAAASASAASKASKASKAANASNAASVADANNTNLQISRETNAANAVAAEKSYAANMAAIKETNAANYRNWMRSRGVGDNGEAVNTKMPEWARWGNPKAVAAQSAPMPGVTMRVGQSNAMTGVPPAGLHTASALSTASDPYRGNADARAAAGSVSPVWQRAQARATPNT